MAAEAVAIVFPVNPATTGSAVTARAHLDDVFGTRAELIVVDDGSTGAEKMRSPDFPERIQLVQHVHNMGKGSAVRSGLLDARGEYVVFTDSDLPFTLDPLAAYFSGIAQAHSGRCRKDGVSPESARPRAETGAHRPHSALDTGPDFHPLHARRPRTKSPAQTGEARIDRQRCWQ